MKTEFVIEVLEEIEEYLDNRADADQPSGSEPIPNEEMNLLWDVEILLGQAKSKRREEIALGKPILTQ